jgi:phosphatidylethanolamine-binding protein (PEBP) family uncharacterized protein
MRPVLRFLAAAALIAGCGGGEKISSDELPRAPAALRVSSAAFIDGARLPVRYTCDGAGEEPPSTKELVLVVSDPDAPGGTFVHLTRYGLRPGGDGSVGHGGVEGSNSAGKTGWTPPCPPKGDDAHRYIWSVYALREPSGLKAGAKPGEVAGMLKDAPVLASGTITARYRR